MINAQSDFISIAKRWLEIDNTLAHQQLLQTWIDTDNQEKLREHFGARLQFGTAGLRGTVGPGTNCMNRGMVQQTSLGIAKYVNKQDLPKKVVIGFDARIDSKQFAQDTADVFHTEGFEVLLFDRSAATPLIAFAVLNLQCTVGIVITASHNPAPDNGYKVYWQNGAQIIPPIDTGIAKCIDELSAQVVWKSHCSGIPHTAPPIEVIDTYFAEIQALRQTKHIGTHLVYTPMHGVGGWAVERALQAAGHTWTIVPEQAEPDGTFPTTQFPNPEEAGALDCAVQTATQVGADAILANDPDADRLAVCLPTQSGWQRLTGDQVGLLFAHYLGESGALSTNALVANTIVSSSQLRSIAYQFGVHYTQTLTGFKWLANAGMAHHAKYGAPLALGYEEALGYSIGGLVQDKDGVSAVLLMADMIAYYQTEQQTLWDVLSRIALQHGLGLSSQHSIKKLGLSGADEIRAMMNQLRENPPSQIAGSLVQTREDYQTLERWTTERREPIQDIPNSNVLVFWLENKERIIVRPSGTEPKIKFYFEVIRPVPNKDALAGTQTEIEQRLEELWLAVQSLL